MENDAQQPIMSPGDSNTAQTTADPGAAMYSNLEPAGTQPTPTIKNAYETAMLLFGGLAILSLLVNNGFFLKLTGGIFLIIATISILRSLSTPKVIYPQSFKSDPSQYSSEVQPPEKKRSLTKYLGLAVLIIVFIPFIAQIGLGFIFLIFLMLSGGGGRMGT